MSDEPTGLRFRLGDLFPADDPVSRWLTLCCIALNDVLRVHKHLLPALETGHDPAASVYFSRLNAAHIYEAAKFLTRSERATEVVAFVEQLDDETRGHYERLKGCSEGAPGSFSAQLKHARDHFFHYAELVPQAAEHERLRKPSSPRRTPSAKSETPASSATSMPALPTR